jgi:hypothetical protein
MSTLREKVAQAICKVKIGGPYPSDERIADAALAALRQWLADEGLVVVPKTATEEMHDDAAEVFHAERVKQYHDSMRLYGKMTYASWPFSERMWVAMIAAAPDALAPDSVEDEA